MPIKKMQIDDSADNGESSTNKKTGYFISNKLVKIIIAGVVIVYIISILIAYFSRSNSEVIETPKINCPTKNEADCESYFCKNPFKIDGILNLVTIKKLYLI